MHSAYTPGGGRTLQLLLGVCSSFHSLCSSQGPAMEGLNVILFYLDIEAKSNIQIQLDHLVRRGKVNRAWVACVRSVRDYGG